MLCLTLRLTAQGFACFGSMAINTPKLKSGNSRTAAMESTGPGHAGCGPLNCVSRKKKGSGNGHSTIH
jgi:hypothetical protein